MYYGFPAGNAVLWATGGALPCIEARCCSSPRPKAQGFRTRPVAALFRRQVFDQRVALGPHGFADLLLLGAEEDVLYASADLDPPAGPPVMANGSNGSVGFNASNATFNGTRMRGNLTLEVRGCDSWPPFPPG